MVGGFNRSILMLTPIRWVSVPIGGGERSQAGTSSRDRRAGS